EEGIKSSPVSVGEITAMYGLPYGVTVYGGIQNATHFNAISTGIGISLGLLGSLSTDITRSIANLYYGNKYRIRYSKSISDWICPY
ncbi:fimbria/pilus outer membrane usher protein, partial [Shigella flexneri]